MSAEKPSFYEVFGPVAGPFLRTYPSIRVWHVGCAEGEVYRMAHALQEGGLLERARIYATDADDMNVLRASLQGDDPAFSPLRARITFFQYDPMCDGSFNEFQLILARVYAPARALALFHSSLSRSGMLGLEPNQTIHASPFAHCYETLDARARLYRRVR